MHWSQAFNDEGTRAVLDAARRGTERLLSAAEARAALAYAALLLDDPEKWEPLEHILAGRADLMITGDPPEAVALLFRAGATREAVL